ncbi:FAD-dependent oxidoreductase [Curvibacter sp. CHRR-16]|nr:FAD-dependent oxidoreductase [Curvibacter sp. CHRR-16]MBT0570369.1 FAD-dependent oxidoreductase [Curvibacter sp. CHRR-16]
MQSSLTVGAASAAGVGLAGCDASGLRGSVSDWWRGQSQSVEHIGGGFVDDNWQRGHWLRDRTQAVPEPTVQRRVQVLIAGGGVAGLAAARALRLRGVDDFALLELEDSAGGNARSTRLQGLACPMGAHYLPVPGDSAHEVQDLLEDLGLRRRVAGRWVLDERTLCHSPQERLWIGGQWQDGLLPLLGVGERTLAQYRQLALTIAQLRRSVRWSMPAVKTPLQPVQQALAAINFVAWLDAQGLDDPHLRWYLNYCCQDDYGAGAATVSAWAGLHYFAARHGFAAPGVERSAEDASEGLFTWPEGNAWLTRQLAAPLGERLHTAQVVLRIAPQRHGVQVDAWDFARQQAVRWTAQQVVVALPAHVAARVVQPSLPWLEQARALVHAPWLVANLHLRSALHDKPGAAPSWDNVLYGQPNLGYVDAQHQSLHPVPGATVLTYYRALMDTPWNETVPAAGTLPPAQAALQARRHLLQTPWADWRSRIVAELAAAHHDLPAKATELRITRHGHAMAVPLPQKSGQIGLYSTYSKLGVLSKREQTTALHTPRVRAQYALATDRLLFAHSDWAGYSVFEEAFTLGHWAGSLA